MKVKIYIEGGGDSKELHSRCREGYRKLIEKCGFTGRMPSPVACGGRQKTYDMFSTAQTSGDGSSYPLLLVDSEDLVNGTDVTPNSPIAWDHLSQRDHWPRPEGVNNNQAQMMTTCMETWIMADQKTISEFFGHRIREKALLPIHNLESRSRSDVKVSLMKLLKTAVEIDHTKKDPNHFDYWLN